MEIELVPLVKRLCALSAVKVFDSCMNSSHMAIQMSFLKEFRVAHGTLERPQVQVVHRVVPELRGREEGLLTLVARVHLVLLDVRVHPLPVLLQIDPLFKGLVTLLAFEGTLAAVGQHVPRQELLLQEPLVAHVANKSLLAHV